MQLLSHLRFTVRLRDKMSKCRVGNIGGYIHGQPLMRLRAQIRKSFRKKSLAASPIKDELQAMDLAKFHTSSRRGGYAPLTPISSRPLARPAGGPICPIFSYIYFLYISSYFPIYFLYCPIYVLYCLIISYIFPIYVL